MSKAFTSDSDEEDALPGVPAFPPGTRNYMTQAGAERLKAEVDQLTAERKHPSLGVEGKDRLAKIDRRLRALIPRIEALEIINPLTQPQDRVAFGASVTVSEQNQKPNVWRIVGFDEANLDQGWISWMSPLASALLEKRAGDVISFMGRRITILKITYQV